MPVTMLNQEDLVSATGVVKYPNPFFDLSNNYIPKNIKTLFKYCKTFFYTSGFLRNVITKLTEYPITDLLFSTTVSKDTREKYLFAFNRKLKLKSFLIEIGLDYFTYGNCFISTYLRPKRFLTCPNCKLSLPYDDFQTLGLKNFRLVGSCPSCKQGGLEFTIDDQYVKSIDNFKLIRWSPENIDIDYNPLTGTSIYYYAIPAKIKTALLKGDKVLLKEIPAVFLESLRTHKSIRLDENNLFHFKRPTLAEDDMGWGKPLILPALKEIYYLQTLKRGNEAISHEHVVPKKSIFPANTTTLDPYSMSPDTLVLTNTGIKELQTIDFESDHLYTYNRQETKITNWKLREIEDWDFMLKVQTCKQPAFPVKVNSVHPFRVWNEEKKEHGWKEAKELCLTDYLAYPTPQLKDNVDSIKTIDIKEVLKKVSFGPSASDTIEVINTDTTFFRFLGLFLAEGYLHKTGRITFTFNSKETELHSFIADYLDALAPNCKEAQIITKGETTQITKCSIKLKYLLETLVGNHSDRKHLTYFREKLDREQLIALLRGIYEGDGCFRYAPNHGNFSYPKLSISLSNLDLSYFIWEYLLSLGYCTSIGGYTRPGKKSYWINDIAGKDAEDLAKMLSFTTKSVNYKNKNENNTFFFKDNFIYTKVSSIKTIKERMVLSIEVDDETHSYLTLAKCNKNTQMNLGKWKGQMEEQIKKWKSDPNHIGVFPIPIGYQELGGNARALLLTPEMKFLEESIINSLGVPLEFIKGGSTWTGSSVSLRIVENHFLTYRELLLECINYFIIEKLVSLLKYPPVEVKFQKFRMADDTNSKQQMLEMAVREKISDATLLDEFGLQYNEEQDALKKTRLSSLEERVEGLVAEAEAQGQAMVVQAKYQMRAKVAAAQEEIKIQSELFQEELARENIGLPDEPMKIIEKFALELMSLDPVEQNKRLAVLSKKMPTTYTLVIKRMQSMMAQQSMEMQYAQQEQEQEKEQKSVKEVKSEKTKGQTRGNP